jgi:hypothetical protein
LPSSIDRGKPRRTEFVPTTYGFRESTKVGGIPPNMPTDPARRESADLPIEHPTMFDPVTSLITAKRLV